MGEKVDFAIITAIEREREAICKTLQMGDDDRVSLESRIYWRKSLELKDGEFYNLVVAQSSDMANVDAALLVADTNHHWHPGAILLVGIAAGVDREKQQFGDLVIASDVYYYERGKLTPDGKRPEPIMYRSDATLWNHIRSLPEWQPPSTLLRPDGTQTSPKIHYGVIASGEKVIADSAVRDEITAGHRKIAAIEMEGYGFGAGIWQSFERVRHLVIKAICDFADAGKRDDWQPYAAGVAADFTKHFLLDRPLAPRNPPISVIPIDLDPHYKLVVQALVRGQLIPFLGEGINLCDRPSNHENASSWQPGQYPPSDGELAEYLVRQFGSPFDATEVQCPISQQQNIPEGCPMKEKLGPNEVFTCPLFKNQKLVAERKDLQALSQYVDLIFGSLGLYEELHEIFATTYQPNQLHNFFAKLPRIMHEKGYPLPFEILVTTNYDDTLEQAFKQADQPFDLVSYIAKGENRGKFLHQMYSGESHVIHRPNEYGKFPFGKYPIILKLYGAVDRNQGEEDNFVITEDHYIDYISHENALPNSLWNKILRSHILFLGYDLSDWKLRLILRRIWQEQPLDKCKSWVVRLKPGRLEQQLWEDRRVAMVERSLEAYITVLGRQIDALPAKEVPHGLGGR